MDIHGFATLLNACSALLRNGEPVHTKTVGPLQVTTIDALPAVSDVLPGVEVINLVLCSAGVHTETAEQNRAAFIQFVDDYPDLERLADGPSYIEVGGVLGSQSLAFQMFAVGQSLGLWKVITPTTLGITGPEATELAGMGMIMMSGYKPAVKKD